MENTNDLKEESLLPIVVKDRSLTNILNVATKQGYDLGRKFLKILGAGAIGFVGLGVASIGNPIVTTAGIATSIYSIVRGAQNILYKTEPGLMFVTRASLYGERKILQDTRIGLASHMYGYNKYEKAGMMALQALIGSARFKENLKGTPYMQKEDGTRVYTQKYSTVTHTVNLRTFEALSDLGLIEIESIDEKFKNTGKIAQKLKLQPKGKKSFLIPEKIGFNNFKSLTELSRAAIKGDKEELEKNKVVMKKITFRLTDKPIDFEDMYLKLNNAKPYESEKEKEALKTFGLIFNKRRGVLGKKNIDIGKDVLGRDVILYNRKEENFSQRMEYCLEKGIEQLNAIKEEKSKFSKAKRRE